jgi:hypothetical protein
LPAGLSTLVGTETHYDTLGVSPAATQEEIRRAYHRLARGLHPDRHVASAPARAAAAARRMQEVNAAWTVLSNQASRELYDADLRLASVRAAAGASPGPAEPASATAGQPTGGGAGPTVINRARPTYVVVEPPDHWSPVFRGMPWVLVLIVLGFIFVFTAFAADSSDDAGQGVRAAPTTTAPPPPRAGDCVVMAGPNAVRLVDCDLAHDAQIAELAPLGRPCPRPSFEMYLPDQGVTACLDFAR